MTLRRIATSVFVKIPALVSLGYGAGVLSTKVVTPQEDSCDDVPFIMNSQKANTQAAVICPSRVRPHFSPSHTNAPTQLGSLVWLVPYTTCRLLDALAPTSEYLMRRKFDFYMYISSKVISWNVTHPELETHLFTALSSDLRSSEKRNVATIFNERIRATNLTSALSRISTLVTHIDDGTLSLSGIEDVYIPVADVLQSCLQSDSLQRLLLSSCREKPPTDALECLLMFIHILMAATHRIMIASHVSAMQLDNLHKLLGIQSSLKCPPCLLTYKPLIPILQDTSVVSDGTFTGNTRPNLLPFRNTSNSISNDTLKRLRENTKRRLINLEKTRRVILNVWRQLAYMGLTQISQDLIANENSPPARALLPNGSSTDQRILAITNLLADVTKFCSADDELTAIARRFTTKFESQEEGVANKEEAVGKVEETVKRQQAWAMGFGALMALLLCYDDM